MSLINDALKQATKSPSTNAGTPDPGQPMRPADTQRTVGLPRYFFPLLLCLFCGAGWFVIRGWQARPPGAEASAGLPVQAREARTPVSTPTPSGLDPADASIPDTTATGDVLAVADENTPIPPNRDFSVNDPSTPKTQGAAQAASGPPALRLQGIFYRATRASAVINSETLFVGDTIAGARVKAIDRGAVTLEQNGQTQVLTLR